MKYSLDKYPTEYFKTVKWKRLRQQVLNIQKKCRICGTKENLEVHHLYYKKSMGSIPHRHMVVLCKDHHKKCHQIERLENLHHMKPFDLWFYQLDKIREREGIRPRSTKKI